MTGRRFLLTLLGLAAGSALAAPPAELSFTPDSLASITARHCGRGPFALAVWSIDCPHCKAGLQVLEKLRRQRPGLHVVLVQADVSPPPEAGPAMLSQAGVVGSERWVFADQAPERLRYAIDPEWAGELPRTYLYDQHCGRVAVSGALSDESLRRWLGRGEKS
jgi:thiol-disulfide isomerase/thioredoxin